MKLTPLLYSLLLFHLEHLAYSDGDEEYLVEEYDMLADTSWFTNETLAYRTFPYLARDFVCPRRFGRFRHHSCKNYYLCVFGYPLVCRCLYKDLFDTRIRLCAKWFLATCEEILPQNHTFILNS